MPRRGWQQLDVPSGWVRVLRGPRPKSEQWPAANEKKDVAPREVQSGSLEDAFLDSRAVCQKSRTTGSSRARVSSKELGSERVVWRKSSRGPRQRSTHVCRKFQKANAVFGVVGSTSSSASRPNRCSGRCFRGGPAGEDQRSAEGAGCFVGSSHPSFAKASPSVDGRWSIFIGQHSSVAQCQCPGRGTSVELPQLQDAERSGIWGSCHCCTLRFGRTRRSNVGPISRKMFRCARSSLMSALITEGDIKRRCVEGGLQGVQ